MTDLTNRGAELMQASLFLGVGSTRRNAGCDQTILAARHEVYLRARELNPALWSGATRNWSPIGAVTLNPEHDAVIKMQLDTSSSSSKALAA